MTRKDKRAATIWTFIWLGIGVVIFAVVMLNGRATGSMASKDEMSAFCVEQVAQWAAVTPSDVTVQDISDQNTIGNAWDFQGSYGGGDWACGGRQWEQRPGSVMVYPGGRGALLEDALPEQIYSN